jgi:hypothetical protein
MEPTTLAAIDAPALVACLLIVLVFETGLALILGIALALVRAENSELVQIAIAHSKEHDATPRHAGRAPQHGFRALR